MHAKLSYHLFIFSADRVERDSWDNLKRSADTASRLARAGVQFAVAVGHWQGTTENSFCAYLPQRWDSAQFQKQEELIKELCRDNEQDSYLVVSPEYSGFLHNVRLDARLYIGRATFLTERPTADSYTEFANGTFLVVEE